MTEEPYQLGNPIQFVLTLSKEITMANDVNIRSHGQVVRIDQHNGTTGIAAQIERYEFLPIAA